MTESNLISDGVLLMLIGMGTVYLFLSLLVFLTTLLFRWLGETIEVAPVSDKTINQTEEIVAISAAIHQYRSKQSINKD